jgi:hypothetical protein
MKRLADKTRNGKFGNPPGTATMLVPLAGTVHLSRYCSPKFFRVHGKADPLPGTFFNWAVYSMRSFGA